LRNVLLDNRPIVGAVAERMCPSPSSSGLTRRPLRRTALRRTGTLTWLLAVSLLPVSVRSAEDAGPAYEQFLKINYVFNREHYELAIPQYEKLLVDYPKFDQKGAVHYALALCHYSWGTAESDTTTARSPTSAAPSPSGADAPTPQTPEHLEEAVRHLEAALKLNGFKEKDAALHLLGQCCLSLGDYPRAGKAFSKVLGETSRQEGVSVDALLGLADAYYLAEKYGRAAKAYRKTLELEGSSAEQLSRARFYLGMAIFHAEGLNAEDSTQLDEAAENFLAVAATPGKYTGDALYMAALVSERRGDSETARAQLKSLVSEGATSERYRELATFGLARSYAVNGEDTEAIPLLQDFLAKFSESSHANEASLYLAKALVRRSKYKSAVAILNKLRHASGVGPDAALSLARILTQYKKHDKAVKVLEAAIASHGESPRRARLRVELTRARIADGQYKDATLETDALLAAAASPELEAEALYLKSYALLYQQAYEDAVRAARSFLANHPDSSLRADAQQIKAEGLFLSGEYEAASLGYQAYLQALTQEDTSAQTPAKRRKAQFRLAQTAYFQGEYESAAERLSELAEEPAGGNEESRGFFATAPYLAGDCAYQLGRYEDSIDALGRFLAAAEPDANSPQLADARFKRAHALQLSGDGTRARVAYEAALATGAGSPQATQIRFELGQLAFEERDFADAKKHLTATIARITGTTVDGDAVEDGDDYAPYAHRLLGWIAIQEEDFAGAHAHYAKIVEEFPTHELAAEAEFQAAVALQNDGRHEEAQEALAIFRAKHPGDERGRLVQLQQAVSLSKLGKAAEALAALVVLRKAMSESDADQSDFLGRVLYETAWCQRTLAQPGDAMASYRTLLSLPEPSPTSASATGHSLRRTAHLELAELQFEAEDYRGALKQLEPLLELRQGEELSNRALYRATWCYHKLGDFSHTIRSYEAYARNAPKSEWLPELAFLAAKAHFETHDLGEAAKLFQSIYTRYPKHPEAEFALVGHGECLSEERAFPAARQRFQHFLKAYPESGLVYRARFGLGWVMENTGQLDEAMEVYRTVVRETSTPTAARAQFQLGQCHVAKENYRDAVIELLQVSARYSYPEWSAKALLQTGGCFEALEDIASARKYYKEVVAQFAERDEARLAKERLSQLGLN
jgi:TolA-binding protein